VYCPSTRVPPEEVVNRLRSVRVPRFSEISELDTSLSRAAERFACGRKYPQVRAALHDYYHPRFNESTTSKLEQHRYEAVHLPGVCHSPHGKSRIPTRIHRSIRVLIAPLSARPCLAVNEAVVTWPRAACPGCLAGGTNRGREAKTKKKHGGGTPTPYCSLFLQLRHDESLEYPSPFGGRGPDGVGRGTPRDRSQESVRKLRVPDRPAA
jgi:hypothetical protein